MMRTFLQWLLLSTCVLLLYCRAYGRKGAWIAVLFLTSILAFLWLLNRADGDKP